MRKRVKQGEGNKRQVIGRWEGGVGVGVALAGQETRQMISEKSLN